MGKRIFAASLVVAVWLGLALGTMSGETLAVQSTPCAGDTNDQVRAIAATYSAAFAERDVETLAGLLSSDMVRDAPQGSDAGSNAAIVRLEALFDAFPDFTMTTNLTVVEAPFVAAHFTATGTQATTFADSEPTGTQATWDGMYLLTIECGAITHIWSEVDQPAQRSESAPILATPVAPAENASPASCPELTRDTAQSLMDTWYNQMWTGELDLLATMTTPDVYHHWAMGPDSSGQDAQLDHLHGTIDMLPGLTSAYDAFVVEGDYIAVHWEQSLGEDTWDGLNIFRTECGLIAEVWSEMNVNELPAWGGSATPEA